jgi:hypothetical protein
MQYISGENLQTILTNSQQKIVLYVLTDHKYIKTTDGEFFSSFDHPDYPTQSTEGLVINNAYTINIKELVNLGVVVNNSVDLLYFNDTPEVSKLSHFYHTKLPVVKNVNRIIPLYSHLESMQEIGRQLKPKKGMTDRYKTMYHHLIPSVFSSIERLGVPVNDELFLNHYGQDKRYLIQENRVYTSYNIYTKTGRPSNTHGGINYAALNKTDGSRDIFQSNKLLVNIDFNSYHLFLICEKLGIEIPKNAHEWLGKMYFNKDTLNDVEYDEAKKITFRNLYGYEMDENVKSLQLFQEIQKFQENLWTQYQSSGYLVTDYDSEIVVDNPSKNKVFNYYIQALETETNAKQLHSLIVNGVTPILYTYDSMVFEITPDEVEFTRDVLKDKLLFPYTAKVGHNFNF